MSILILIINYNEKKVTNLCLESIKLQTSINHQTVLVDNGSREEEKVKDPGIKTIQLNKNYGFPFAVNLGVKACQGDWILVLNNDCELQENFIEEMTKATEKYPEGKVFSPKIFQSLTAREGILRPSPNGEGAQDDAQQKKMRVIYSCGDDIDEKGLARNIGRGEVDRGQYDEVKTVPLATFACILIKKEILEKFPLDESYFGYYEDVDFCLRLQKAKVPIYFAPNAVCRHLGEASFSKLNNLDNEIRQFKNLSLTVIKHFSIKNIVRHYLLFNLKSFRYYFFMKKKWKFIFTEIEIVKQAFIRLKNELVFSKMNNRIKS